ncbi:hypothetical protein [Mycolicibacterium helvum]|uniref:Uncharacterized protein n=1 Tax=Mycolicibacterium helvum TaxID=1534349 RepID=A0A7I7TB95_9MYCO|nr:hypothetical protein [Mycolicibacterium helvum]BBY65751.1 hypothetical protein MHEL_39940 [Mycolicibacterium helvum]
MDPVGSLSLLLIAIAALAALGGYIAGVVRERRQRRAGRYFLIGVVTGFIGATVVGRRISLGALGPVARRLVLSRRLDHPLTVAALQLRRGLSRAGISR